MDKARILQLLRDRWDAGVGRQSSNAYRMNDEWLHGGFGQNDLSASSAGDALWLYERSGDKMAARKYYDYAVNQTGLGLRTQPVCRELACLSQGVSVHARPSLAGDGEASDHRSSSPGRS